MSLYFKFLLIMPQEPTNLFSWITQIKQNHGAKKFPVEATRVSTSISNSEKKSIIFTKYFKGNIMSFHRPHGLIFKRHNRQQQNSTTEAALSRVATECSCCAQGCCSSTGHHRHSTTSLPLDDSLDQSAPSEEDTSKCSLTSDRRVSADTQASNNSSAKETSESTQQSVDSSRRTSKTSSILLDDDRDNPLPYYKKLREDGNLVDYDDISEQDETNSDDVVLRSAISNSLVRLALNG